MYNEFEQNSCGYFYKENKKKLSPQFEPKFKKVLNNRSNAEKRIFSKILFCLQF